MSPEFREKFEALFFALRRTPTRWLGARWGVRAELFDHRLEAFIGRAEAFNGGACRRDWPVTGLIDGKLVFEIRYRVPRGGWALSNAKVELKRQLALLLAREIVPGEEWLGPTEGRS